MGWLVPREELTLDQWRAIDMPVNEHQVILGGPGSGKTIALVYRAWRLCHKHQIRHDRFRIFAFTNVLKRYIQSGVSDLGLPQNCVQTLDDWCVHYYQNQIGPAVPWDVVRRRPDFPETRKAVLAARLGMPPDYEFALVDEGQDLDLVRFELLKKIAKHITVCVDEKQQIFDEGSTEEEIVRTLGLRRGNVTLLDAYRCSPYIVRTAAEFIPDDAERAAFLNQGRMAQTERQTLLLYMARDFNDEMKRLVEIVRERQIVDQRIAILFYRNDQVHGFTTGLREEGLEVETREALDFDSGAPKVLTLHSAKGLTFDTVIMPRLRQAAFPPLMTTSRREKLLFVGITRATKWVYLSAEDSQAISELDRVKKLSMLPNAPVTLQSWRDGPSSQPEGKLPREEDPDSPTDLLDLL